MVSSSPGTSQVSPADGHADPVRTQRYDPEQVRMGTGNGLTQLLADRSGPKHAHRLLVLLLLGPGLARFGPGVRLVALISAAHAGRVALIWPARAGCRFRARRGSRRVCRTRSSVALPAR